MVIIGDKVLVDLMAAVEAGGTSPNITLLVSGAVLVGHVIARQTWIDATRQKLRVLPVDAKNTAEQVLAALEEVTPADPSAAVHLDGVEVNGRPIGLLRMPIERIDGVCLK